MSRPSRFGDKAFEWLTLAMAIAVVLLISWLVGSSAWLVARHPKIWISFSRHIDMGSGRGAIRRAPIHLWHGGFFSDCVYHCGAVGNRDGSLFH